MKRMDVVYKWVFAGLFIWFCIFVLSRIQDLEDKRKLDMTLCMEQCKPEVGKLSENKCMNKCLWGHKW
jgi:hypothetical protein